MSSKASIREYVERIQTATISVALIDNYPQNYNFHPETQLVDLEESYKRRGQFLPKLVWKRPGGRYTLVIGEGFTAGAKRGGASEIRCEVLPEDTPEEYVREILLADNLHARNSVPDEDILARLLKDQQLIGVPLESMGASEDMLQDMLAKMTPPTLDELTTQYGDEPEEEAFWPVIRVKVSPETKELYDTLIQDAEGEDEGEQFAWLLERVNVAVET